MKKRLVCSYFLVLIGGMLSLGVSAQVNKVDISFLPEEIYLIKLGDSIEQLKKLPISINEMGTLFSREREPTNFAQLFFVKLKNTSSIFEIISVIAYEGKVCGVSIELKPIPSQDVKTINLIYLKMLTLWGQPEKKDVIKADFGTSSYLARITWKQSKYDYSQFVYQLPNAYRVNAESEPTTPRKGRIMVYRPECVSSKKDLNFMIPQAQKNIDNVTMRKFFSEIE